MNISSAPARTLLLNLALIIASVVVALLMVELALRYYFFGGVALVPVSNEAQFWRYDSDLGWSPVPGASGRFENAQAGFSGQATFDSDGVRVNGNGYDRFQQTLLVIGDSITVGLEVDNNETFSAILERSFHEAGCRVRVVNAGVRGYGSDQAYWRLMQVKQRIHPDAVLYLAVHNDFLNNRTVKRVHRLYSKPVFVLGEEGTMVQNRPAERMPKNAYAYLEYDEQGNVEYRRGIQAGGDGVLKRVKVFLQSNTALYYPLRYIYDRWDSAVRAGLEPGFRPFDLEVMRGILRRMVGAAGTLYVSANPLAYADSRGAQLDHLDEISSEVGARFVNISASFPGDPASWHWRGDAHWNQAGHQRVAESLYTALAADLCPSPGLR